VSAIEELELFESIINLIPDTLPSGDRLLHNARRNDLAERRRPRKV
jgi:hypothetical protein